MAVVSLQHHDHVVRHAPRVLLVRCLSPAELGRSNERGVYQDVVSNRDQEDDRQTDQRATINACYKTLIMTEISESFQECLNNLVALLSDVVTSGAKVHIRVD